jgi:hypothetical protein
LDVFSNWSLSIRTRKLAHIRTDFRVLSAMRGASAAFMICRAAPFDVVRQTLHRSAPIRRQHLALVNFACRFGEFAAETLCLDRC